MLKEHVNSVSLDSHLLCIQRERVQQGVGMHPVSHPPVKRLSEAAVWIRVNNLDKKYIYLLSFPLICFYCLFIQMYT